MSALPAGIWRINLDRHRLTRHRQSTGGNDPCQRLEGNNPDSHRNWTEAPFVSCHKKEWKGMEESARTLGIRHHPGLPGRHTRQIHLDVGIDPDDSGRASVPSLKSISG